MLTTALIDPIRALLASFLDSLLCSAFVGLSESILNGACSVYNTFIGYAITLLTQSPTNWNGGSGWSVVTGLNQVFITVGGILVIIFWAISLCTDSLDVRMNLRAEVVIKELAKLVVVEFFVLNSITIVEAFFGLADYLCAGMLPSASEINLSIPADVTAYLDKLGDKTNFLMATFESMGGDDVGMATGADVGAAIATTLFSLVFLIVVFACSLTILYRAYVRFFKVLILAPYGAMVSSTLVGPPSINHSAISYFKYVLSVVLEVVTMIIALRLASSMMVNGIVNLGGGNVSVTDQSTMLQWIAQSCFIVLLTSGVCKESEGITQKALGM